MMDPRELLAHHLKSYREQHDLTLDELAQRTGVNKGQLYAAENPSNPKYADSRAFVCNKLDDILAQLELTFAPVDDVVPSVAHIISLIDRMEASAGAKSVAMAAVHAAGLTRIT
jgi:DNA-binding XRE family transcriptional regulator